MNFFIPLYVLALYGLILYLTKPKGNLKPAKINWSPLEAVSITLLLYFGTQFLAGMLLLGFGLLKGWSGSELTSWTETSIFSQFFYVVIVEALVVWLLYKFLLKRKASFKTIGLIKPRLSDIAYALIGFAVYFALLIAVLQLAKSLIPSINLDQEQQVGFDAAAGPQLLLVFISLVVLPPIVEELLIRGFLYSGLKKVLPKIWAVLLTSILFGIAHLQAGNGEPLLWVAAIDTFLLSLVLIYLRDKTGGLWASIYLHTLKNGIAFLALFVFGSALLR